MEGIPKDVISYKIHTFFKDKICFGLKRRKVIPFTFGKCLDLTIEYLNVCFL